MKTGRSKTNNSDIFYIILQGLDAILRRVSFKDSVLFKEHNSFIEMNHSLMNSAINFNLFSNYGIGKKIESMTEELLKKQKLNPEKYLNNIFYKEIVRLSPEISFILREENTDSWSYEYAIKNLNTLDEISNERLERLLELFEKQNTTILEIENETFEICECGFCEEFRKYNFPTDKNINDVILDLLFNFKDT